MVLDQQEPHWHNMFNDLHYFKNAVCGDFSGGDSVVKTPHSHCMGSIPAWGTRISCAAWAQPKKKNAVYRELYNYEVCGIRAARLRKRKKNISLDLNFR